jgi:hypothetical protein
MEKLMEIIEVLKVFESKEAQFYWLNSKALNLTASEKGFIIFYLGYFETL